ncbi:hypothetical protein PPERSA_05442 [Pseudocohnilembus persalinus]|uniref:Uncharacterized protein n=1 Tax=Pseudocohnilembus persalinus TaxID=266149 RepID=A0A0V0R819_PSEPJ|nr:hypothetical protein PPERSA_05442 [Pseudocohnilembus persalinus]|eukprot:KRX10622.1 hypothetical protein PPERSA_05442 [Pseudocohnilembus persalinus]
MEQEYPVDFQQMNTLQNSTPNKNSSFNYQQLQQNEYNLNGLSSMISVKSSQYGDQFSSLINRNSEIQMENSTNQQSVNLLQLDMSKMKGYEQKQQSNYLEELQTTDETPVFSQQMSFKQKINMLLSENSQIEQVKMNNNNSKYQEFYGVDSNNQNQQNRNESISKNIGFNDLNFSNNVQQLFEQNFETSLLLEQQKNQSCQDKLQNISKGISINIGQINDNDIDYDDLNEQQDDQTVSHKKLIKLQYLQEQQEQEECSIQEEQEQLQQGQLCNFSQHCLDLDKRELLQERKQLEKLKYDINSDIVSFINEMKKNERLQQIQQKIDSLTKKIQMGGYDDDDEVLDENQQSQQDISSFSQTSLFNQDQPQQKPLWQQRRNKMGWSASNNNSNRNKKKTIQQQKWSQKKQQQSLQDIVQQDDELDIADNFEIQGSQSGSNSNCSNKRKLTNCYENLSDIQQQDEDSSIIQNINKTNNININFNQHHQQQLFGQFNSQNSLFNNNNHNNQSSNESLFGLDMQMELGYGPRKQTKSEKIMKKVIHFFMFLYQLEMIIAKFYIND